MTVVVVKYSSLVSAIAAIVHFLVLFALQMLIFTAVGFQIRPNGINCSSYNDIFIWKEPYDHLVHKLQMT